MSTTGANGGEGEDPGVSVGAAAGANGNGNGAGFQNPQLSGITGIQINWPVHPGELGLAGAKKHKKWKRDVKTIMRLRHIKEDDAALYIQMNVAGRAAGLLQDLEFEDITFAKLMSLFELHFKGDDDEIAEEAHRVFLGTARRHSEPMYEYVLRLEHNRDQYLEKEEGSKIVPRVLAKQLLARAGLSRADQKQVRAFVQGAWDYDLIKAQLLQTHKDVHREDHHAIKKGKTYRRNPHKTWVAHVDELEPEDVESEPDDDDADLTHTTPTSNGAGYDAWPTQDGYETQTGSEEWVEDEFGNWWTGEDCYDYYGTYLCSTHDYNWTIYHSQVSDWESSEPYWPEQCDEGDEQGEEEEGEDEDDYDYEDDDADEEAALSLVSSSINFARRGKGSGKGSGKKKSGSKKPPNMRGFVPPGAGKGSPGGPMFNPAHKGPCKDCTEAGIAGKDFNGNPVPGHWGGDPGCPLVRLPAGHPKKKPLHSSYQKGKGKGKGSSKGKRPKGKGKGKSKGKGKGKGKSHSVNVASVGMADDSPAIELSVDVAPENAFVPATSRASTSEHETSWQDVPEHFDDISSQDSGSTHMSFSFADPTECCTEAEDMERDLSEHSHEELQVNVMKARRELDEARREKFELYYSIVKSRWEVFELEQVTYPKRYQYMEPENLYNYFYAHYVYPDDKPEIKEAMKTIKGELLNPNKEKRSFEQERQAALHPIDEVLDFDPDEVKDCTLPEPPTSTHSRPSKPQKVPLCHPFTLGFCKKGYKCQHSHDMPEGWMPLDFHDPDAIWPEQEASPPPKPFELLPGNELGQDYWSSLVGKHDFPQDRNYEHPGYGAGITVLGNRADNPKFKGRDARMPLELTESQGCNPYGRSKEQDSTGHIFCFPCQRWLENLTDWDKHHARKDHISKMRHWRLGDPEGIHVMKTLGWRYNETIGRWVRPRPGSSKKESEVEDTTYGTVPASRAGTSSSAQHEFASSACGSASASGSASSTSKESENQKGTDPRKGKEIGTFEHVCPDCDTKLVAVSLVGGFKWECQNPSCHPPPPLARLSKEQKAKMKSPGVNPWNDFNKAMKGQGYTPDQINHMYQQKKQQLAESSATTTSAPEKAATRKSASAKLKKPSEESPSSSSGPTTSPASPASEDLKVYNLNTVSESELLSVKGLTPGLVKNILSKRSEMPFKRVTELNDITGIGRVTYGKIVHRFVVHTSKE